MSDGWDTQYPLDDPDGPVELGPPRHAGEVRVIDGTQVIARPSVNGYLVWTNTQKQGRQVAGLLPEQMLRITRAQHAETHVVMLVKSSDERRFREFMDKLPDLPTIM